jgi:hypothetical protein
LANDRRCSEQNLVDIQIGSQVQLDPDIVLEHPESDSVLSANEFLFRIDTDIEMVIEQIVVRAIPSIFTAEYLRAPAGVLPSGPRRRSWQETEKSKS